MSALTLLPYKRRWRRDVRDLLFSSYRTHSHLDWYDTDQWLDTDGIPMRLAWVGGRLVGLLATSIPLNQTCWIRLASVHDDFQPGAILAALWGELLPELRAQQVHTVALLVMRDWIAHYAGDLGFAYSEDIITLRRPPLPVGEGRPLPPDVVIRSAGWEDLRELTAIDQAAFVSPYQLTLGELMQAERNASATTVALLSGVMVGYQLSTLYFDGAHLARLAVAPAAQGRGIGYALVDDLLRRFDRRNVRAMTVNTQASNIRSQQLYARFGFARNGYDLPVYMARV